MPLGKTRETATELRAVAPLVMLGAAPRLVGSCTLITNGERTIGFSSAELLRLAGEPLAIATKLDGSQTIPVASWMMGRNAAIGIIELGAAFPDDESLDVAPLQLGSVCATLDTRGAPAALVVIQTADAGFSRRIVPVHIDAQDGGGMLDEVTRLASPIENLDVDAIADGAALYAWLPPDPVLGRSGECVVVALGVTHRSKLFKPRDLPPLAELVGLEDLGRALPWHAPKPEPASELAQVAGEIRDVASGPSSVIADLEREKP
ncbi:MAG: hypothetical protein JWO36_7108 [Myxococcales bacterium]|nr:hypothetical protein [Myxococcales bacterium]